MEDSSDEEQKRKAVPSPKVDRVLGTSPAPTPPLSPNTMKKKGLFSRFRSKKDKDESPKSRPVAGITSNRDTALAKSPSAFQNKNTNGARSKDDDDDERADGAGFENMGFGSAAERDAIIAQTMARLEAAKGGNASPKPEATTVRDSELDTPIRDSVSNSVASGSPVAGRLQRRVTPQRFASDSWPLPPKIEAVEDATRPSTADAPNGRPGVGNRIPTSETLRTEGGTPIVGRTGKKKRFPMLRKAFGLKD